VGERRAKCYAARFNSADKSPEKEHQVPSKHRVAHRVVPLVIPQKLPVPIHPALIRQAQERAASVQNRIADAITTFAGSMLFVYIHILWFGCWIGFGVEDYPFGLLTMIVSLEAIFLSTFVMISQNRADAKRQAIADAQWKTVQEEEQQNEQLLDISRQILKLTQEVHSYGDSVQARDKELLAMSKETLALTKRLAGGG
jgi:uncharacterized membrane protein